MIKKIKKRRDRIAMHVYYSNLHFIRRYARENIRERDEAIAAMFQMANYSDQGAAYELLQRHMKAIQDLFNSIYVKVQDADLKCGKDQWETKEILQSVLRALNNIKDQRDEAIDGFFGENRSIQDHLFRIKKEYGHVRLASVPTGWRATALRPSKGFFANEVSVIKPLPLDAVLALKDKLENEDK